MEAHPMMTRLKALYQGQAKHEHFKISKTLFSSKLATDNPVGIHIFKMIDEIKTLEKLDALLHPMLATDLIFGSLPIEYSKTVVNFYMNKLEMTMHELLKFLKTAEESLGKGKGKCVLMIDDITVAKNNGPRSPTGTKRKGSKKPKPASNSSSLKPKEGAKKKSVAVELTGYLRWLEEKGGSNNDIDRLADMFIADSHERFRLEKVESYRRFQEMLARSTCEIQVLLVVLKTCVTQVLLQAKNVHFREQLYSLLTRVALLSNGFYPRRARSTGGADNHFTTWDQLHGEFLKRFFPPSKTAKIRRMIQNFKQNPNEPLYEDWERFKDLQRQCLHHNIQSWHLMTDFYKGLNENSQILLDASASGSFMSLELDEAEELIEWISTNGSTWYSDRPSAQPKIGGMYEVDQMSAMAAKVNSIMSMIQKISQVSAVQNTKPTPPPVPVLMCVSCGGQHDQSSCPWDSMQQVDNVNYYRPQQQQNPFGGFNSQNRNHLGFSWSNPGGAAIPMELPIHKLIGVHHPAFKINSNNNLEVDKVLLTINNLSKTKASPMFPINKSQSCQLLKQHQLPVWITLLISYSNLN
ncbi:unnamed protein product [Cuscuta campestris]|uniref:Retrotransposon gag domain-containing protein n=1 Tax=Cuscuta campestris TaxID=132261 RepID=A0A484LC62_9ASTE|nr:unnamed protein product [Cuscuta campestris]